MATKKVAFTCEICGKECEGTHNQKYCKARKCQRRIKTHSISKWLARIPKQQELALTGDWEYGKPTYVPDAGDVFFYSTLDARGRANLKGRHSNYGYSGYLKACVFDGGEWFRLDLDPISPFDERRYTCQYEIDAACERIGSYVKRAAGEQIRWNDGMSRFTDAP